jgi:LysM repeat protein
MLFGPYFCDHNFNGMKVCLYGFLVFIFLFPQPLHSQDARMTREDYIRTYKDMAISEMIRSGVPASITLAQGMLESDNGNSRLARKANNHFGIKCHSDWKGKRIYHDDDEKGECFRKYKSVVDSYDDHSDFLMNTPRYASLFELKSTDYKGWARGLKKAGYATSRQYAELLIRIIEENELHQYDIIDDSKGKRDRRNKNEEESKAVNSSGRKIYERNRIDYIIVKEGDSFESLRKELQLLPNELYKYNDLSKDAVLEPGEILYLQPKRKKAEKGNNSHIVKAGETMQEISQLYGVGLETLYERNNLKYGDQPEEGTEILLRKRKKVDLNKIFESDIPEESEKLEFEFVE